MNIFINTSTFTALQSTWGNLSSRDAHCASETCFQDDFGLVFGINTSSLCYKRFQQSVEWSRYRSLCKALCFLHKTLFQTAPHELVSPQVKSCHRWAVIDAVVSSYTEYLPVQLAAFLLTRLLTFLWTESSLPKEVEQETSSLAWQSQASNYFYWKGVFFTI